MILNRFCVFFFCDLNSKKANPNHQDKSGKTVLMEVSTKENIQIVEFLLNNNANVNLVDSNGETCVFYALRSNSSIRLKLLNLFSKKGASINSPNTQKVI